MHEDIRNLLIVLTLGVIGASILISLTELSWEGSHAERIEHCQDDCESFGYEFWKYDGARMSRGDCFCTKDDTPINIGKPEVS